MIGILYLLSTALLLSLSLKSGVVLLDPQTFRYREIPWVAIGLTVVAIAGMVVQLSWSGAFDALANVPGRAGWWRPFTATFLQSGGAFGVVFNLITLPMAVAIATWCWGHWGALALFVVGMIGPSLISGALFQGSHAQDLGENPRNFVGSSGATFLLAATVAGALVASRIRTSIRDVTPALAMVTLGLVSWFWLANAHGLVSCYGFVIGVVVSLVAHRFASTVRSPGGRRGSGAITPTLIHDRLPIDWRPPGSVATRRNRGRRGSARRHSAPTAVHGGSQRGEKVHPGHGDSGKT